MISLRARGRGAGNGAVWTFAVLAHLAAPRGCCGDLADDLESGHGLSMRGRSHFIICRL